MDDGGRKFVFVYTRRGTDDDYVFFGVSQLSNGSAVIMAAEWMQPKDCEKYGSDNTIFITFAA